MRLKPINLNSEDSMEISRRSNISLTAIKGNKPVLLNKIIATTIVKEIANLDTLSSKLGLSTTLPAELNV